MAGYQLIVYVDLFGPRVCQTQVFVLLKLSLLDAANVAAACSFAVQNMSLLSPDSPLGSDQEAEG